MKQIIKIAEPTSLVLHRANRPAYFDNLPATAKEDLRQSLLAEQGHICCYCMKRIPEKVQTNGSVSYDMKIEHFQCQENFPLLQLTYNNLFGACTGNEGKPKRLQTCDTKKGNLTLTINPISNGPNCDTLFRYNSEGEIRSINDNEEINRQLNEVLNLNMQTLKDGRRQVYLEVQKRVEAESRHLGNKQLRVGYFEQEREKWLNRTNNKYKPFCMVAIYYLTKKIRQNQI
jgi:uncharacterized protein (TIGR02646 family)